MPKDVKEFWISRQTLWNVKQKIVQIAISQLAMTTKKRMISWAIS